MPTLDDPEAHPYVRMIAFGNSGCGKTGSLVSLLQAGYKLAILDLDDGLAALRAQVRIHCPELAGAVHFRTVPKDRHRRAKKMEVMDRARVLIPSKAEAYEDALAAIEEWEIDGKKPYELGPDWVFVVDTLTALGRAAFNLADSMNPTLKDGRQLYNLAQDSVAAVMDELCSNSFGTHLICFTHVTEKEGDPQSYPATIGSAFSKNIGRYVNELVYYKVSGKGDDLSRTIHTRPLRNIDLKMSAPDVEGDYPIETGLAQIFEKLTQKGSNP